MLLDPCDHAEAGYGMEPVTLVEALRSAGAAGCNLEDTDHATETLHDPGRHAQWLKAVRQAAEEIGYPLVINARVDVFLGPFLAGADPGTQDALVPEALERANTSCACLRRRRRPSSAPAA